MINLAVTRDGLAVSADIDGIDHINDYKHERGACQLWAELLEDRTCNGGAAFASADEIGALSEAPCILEGVEYSGDGDMTPTGRVWYFSDYMVRDELQELADGKTVVFTQLQFDAPDEFVDAYITAALWSSTDDEGEPLDDGRDSDDISSETLATMRDDCNLFWTQCRNEIECDNGPTGSDGSTQIEMAGHHFWLTRCGHGVGFWDGDWPEPYATTLDEAARAFGNVDLYLGDDGKVWS